MAKKIYDVVAITGEYTNAQGETKKRYLNCGAVFQTDKGMSLKLEGLPVGEWNGWLSLYEPRQQSNQRPQQQQSRSNDPFGGGPVDDDIPFNRLTSSYAI